MGKMTSTKTLILAAMASTALVGIALPGLVSAQDWRNQSQGYNQVPARGYDQGQTNDRRQAEERNSRSNQYGQAQRGSDQRDNGGDYRGNDRADQRDMGKYDRDRGYYHHRRLQDWHQDRRGW